MTRVCASRLWARLDRVSALSSSTVSNSLASATHSSVRSGSTRSLTSLTRTRKWTGSSSGSGWSASNSRMSPTFAPVRCSIELRGDHPGSDQVGVVVGGQAVDLLAVLGAGDVDGHVVLLDRRAIDGGELAVLGAESIDLFVDLLVGHVGAGDLDPEALVARDDHVGADLDDGLEADRARLLTGGDVELRRRR